jgi:hypothetical protein
VLYNGDVVLNPQKLADVLACIISMKPETLSRIGTAKEGLLRCKYVYICIPLIYMYPLCIMYTFYHIHTFNRLSPFDLLTIHDNYAYVYMNMYICLYIHYSL